MGTRVEQAGKFLPCASRAGCRQPEDMADPLHRLPPTAEDLQVVISRRNWTLLLQGGFCITLSWHAAQTMSVLRRIFAMRAAHAGWPGPGFPSSLRRVTWWTATVVPVSQSSHSRLRSRLISCLRG